MAFLMTRFIVFFTTTILLLFTICGKYTYSATRYVGPWEISTIQEAVNNATDNDIIIVRDGNYNEQVAVNKRVTIRSENGYSSTFVSSRDDGRGIFIVLSDFVTIEGFSIYGYGHQYSKGINITNHDNCTIKSNRCGWDNNHGSEYGIYLSSASYNLITDNVCMWNDRGIYTSSKSDNNSILNNTFRYNYLTNIYLNDSNNNIVSGNICENTDYSYGYGILLYNYSNNNILSHNTSYYNRGHGIRIGYFSNYNEIYLNDFGNNGLGNVQEDNLNNNWYSLEKVNYYFGGELFTNHVGNFYDDHTLTDSNGDGITDEDYTSGGSASIMKFPLVATSDNYIVDLSPNLPPSAPVLSSPLNNTIYENYSNVIFTWFPSSDPNGDKIEYCVFLQDGDEDGEGEDIFDGCSEGIFTSETSFTLPITLDPGKRYEWFVKAKDEYDNWSNESALWSFTTGLTLSIGELIDIIGLPFEYAESEYVNNESLYAVVNNCINDPTYRYFDKDGNELINEEINSLISAYAKQNQYYGIVPGGMSPFFDYTWNNDIKNEYSDDDRFNTVYKVPNEELNLLPKFEVISCTDDYPQPVFSTKNFGSYFFTYDSITDPPFGTAINMDDWINYLKAITYYYGRSIDTLTIAAHGTGFTHFLDQPKIAMSEGFSFQKPFLGTDEETKTGFMRLRDEGIISQNATILIFSCYVGSGIEGRNFVQDIANWTGACVYANSDRTSSSDKKILGSLTVKGDWDLDVVKCPEQIGPININNLQAPLDADIQQKLLLPNGIIIEISEGTLSNDGDLSLSEVKDQLDEFGVNTDGLIIHSAYDITLQDTMILNEKSIIVNLPISHIEDPYLSKLTVEYWDDETLQWSGSGISNVNVNLNEKYISFNTEHTSIFSVFTRNTGPIAEAGENQIVYVDDDCLTTLFLDGSGSYDPDDDQLTYLWTWNGGFAEGVNPTIELPLGTHTITLVVNDGIVDSEPDTVTITVVDNTPPAFSATVAPETLWPPNHKMVQIAPSFTVTDNCDANPAITLSSITMNEGDETDTFDPSYDNTTGDGHTLDDIQVDGDGSIYLRAERSGSGDGRIYTLNFTATDASGNTSNANAIVTVPHNQ